MSVAARLVEDSAAVSEASLPAVVIGAIVIGRFSQSSKSSPRRACLRHSRRNVWSPWLLWVWVGRLRVPSVTWTWSRCVGSLCGSISLELSFGLGFGLVVPSLFDSAMAQPEAQPVSVTCCPVLSGGLLPKPIVPTLKIVDGCHWVLVSREDKGVVEFLTGQALWRRPLKGTCVLDALIAARNLASKGPDEDDGIEDLGLDGPAVKRARLRPRSKHSQASAVSVPQAVEPIVDISLKLEEGTSWDLRALRGERKGVLYIEFTTDNMETLFRLYTASASSGEENVEDTSSSPSRRSGVTRLRWLPARRSWDLRYKDKSQGGRLRCKTFSVPSGLSPAEFEAAV
jgi:hypothetical protein